MKTKISIWVLYISLVLIVAGYSLEQNLRPDYKDMYEHEKIRADSLQAVIDGNILIAKMY